MTASPLQSFLDYLKFEKRYSAHTIGSYKTDLEQFFAYLDQQYGSQPLNAIQPVFIRSWMAELKSEAGLSSKSINRKLSSLRSFFRYQLRQGHIKMMPTASLPVPRQAKRLPVFVKEDEMRRLLENLAASTEDWKSLNARMLITLFYATGMRLSELINLKTRQVDFSRKQIKVLGKGNKERIIPVSPAVLDLVKQYEAEKAKQLGADEPYLLLTEKGRRLYPKYAYLLVRDYLGQASTLDQKSPHVLRHSFATHLVNQGADLNAVKELLGHASLAATQVYTHNTIDKLKDVYRKAHPKA